jgi:cyclophilin family peptidyl-prolyl cis-trans isomerase/protein-disulfide isomerase
VPTIRYVTGSAVLLLLAASCAPQAQSMSVVTAVASPTAAVAESGIGCSAVTAPATPASSGVLPPITAADFSEGPDAAAVTLLFYCDFQSAQCEIFNRVLDQLRKDHPKDLRVVLRPFPVPAAVVPALDKSQLSVEAALAAGNQGKFWPMHDVLHAQYSTWATLSAQGFTTWVKVQAAELGLDATRFSRDLASPALKSQATALYESGVALGISGIPTVFINGVLQSRAALSYDGLDATISLIALGSRQFKACPPFDIDPSRQYVATLHTQKGDIVIQLYADKAPLAVNSFVFLAKQGWFDGVTFHRVLPGFVAQTGDPSGTGSGGPGYYFNNEVRSDLLFNKPGVVGMANSGPDTNGSQFFITYGSEPQLDGAYTVFGQVVEGMQTVDSLTPRDPQQSPSLPAGDKILGVTIQVK